LGAVEVIKQPPIAVCRCKMDEYICKIEFITYSRQLNCYLLTRKTLKSVLELAVDVPGQLGTGESSRLALYLAVSYSIPMVPWPGNCRI